VPAMALDVDGTGEIAAVVGAEATRVEVDAVEQFLADHRGAAEEMVEDGNPVPVEIDAGVGRGRSAHQERAAEEGRARQPGQILYRADGIVERAGDVLQLLALQRPPGGRLARLLADDGGAQLA